MVDVACSYVCLYIRVSGWVQKYALFSFTFQQYHFCFQCTTSHKVSYRRLHDTPFLQNKVIVCCLECIPLVIMSEFKTLAQMIRSSVIPYSVIPYVGRRLTPVLTGVREEAVGGAYTLVLEFQVRGRDPGLSQCIVQSVAMGAHAQTCDGGGHCTHSSSRHRAMAGLLFCAVCVPTALSWACEPVRAMASKPLKVQARGRAACLWQCEICKPSRASLADHLRLPCTQVKSAMTLEMWTDRLDRIQNFFGPGIRAEVRHAAPSLLTSHHIPNACHPWLWLNKKGLAQLVQCMSMRWTPTVPFHCMCAPGRVSSISSCSR